MPRDRSPGILQTLAPLRRALGLKIIVAWAVRGIALGTLVGAFALAFMHFGGWSNARLVALLCVVAGVGVGLVLGATRWPPYLQAARVADRHFGLEDRLTTSLQLAGTHSAIARLQAQDLQLQLQGLLLPRGTSVPLHRRDGALVGIGLVLFVALFSVVPPAQPRAAHAAPTGRSRTDIQRIHKVAVLDIPTMIRKLESGLTLSQRGEPSSRALKLYLTALQKQLLQAQSRQAALRSISVTQDQLRRLDATLHPLTSRSLDQLNRALGQANENSATGSGLQGTTQRANQAIREIRQMAAALRHMSPTQRLNLAKKMQQTARTLSDPAIRDQLDKASIALSHNDIQVANQYLRQLANALHTRGENTASHRQLQNIQKALNQAKARLASLSRPNPSSSSTRNSRRGQSHPRTPTPGTRRNAQSPGRASGQRRTGSPGNRSQVGGQSAQTNGKNQYGNNGTVAGVQPRTGGQGGNVSVGTPTPRNQQPGGKFAKVFVPGKVGKGPVISQTGSNSAPRQSRFLPYRQILVQYRRVAGIALERANLPPNEQSFIRRYFTAIAAK